MGINSKPKITDHWSTHPFFYSPQFTSVISRNRYQLVSKFLHFVNNERWDPKDTNRDKLFKVRPLITFMNRRFQEVYVPSRSIAIDEQLLLYKGKLHFKMYIPMKRSRFGIKFFTLCDKLGYTYNTECYTGKNAAEDLDTFVEVHGPLGKSGNVVMRLMRPLLGKGHQLYVDN